MFEKLAALSRLVAAPAKQAGTESVLDACDLARDILGAEEAYVIRAGAPSFIRLGCEDDPASYEIKQRGYWHAWRQAASEPENPVRALVVRDRLVEDVRPL